MNAVAPSSRAWSLAMALAVASAAGCGQAGAHDPEDAREVLVTVLDAWSAGLSMEDAGRQTGAVVTDPRWEAGDRLVAYEVRPETRAVGFDLGYTVELTLESAAGKTTREVAAYTVSTSPRRTVIRSPFDTPPPTPSPTGRRAR